MRRPRWVGHVWSRHQRRQEWEHEASDSARPRAPSPAVMTQQAFGVLPGRDEQHLHRELLKPSHAEALSTMPGLGLSEERLDPDLAFAHRFGVRLSVVVAAHPVHKQTTGPLAARLA